MFPRIHARCHPCRRARPIAGIATHAARASLAVLITFATLLPTAFAEGVDVGKPSALRNLVPADTLEQMSGREYRQFLREATSKNALAPADSPELQRLRRIAEPLIAQAAQFNPRAARWQWEINLVRSRQINAFCMPGGKIVFYTGLVDGLKLTDDEIAAVMGHEIAHALREHARERIAKSQLTSIGAALLGELVGDGRYAGAFRFGGDMLTLKFSRDDETEADAVGLELAARAGYDPRAGVTLWKKMATASRGEPMPWFSTHPSGPGRITEIERNLPSVMPLYERAKAAPAPR